MEKQKFKKGRISTHSLATVSLLCAISIILARVFGIVVPIAGFPALKLNFAFLPLIIAGMLYGPTAGMLCGLVSDLLGYMINPQGGAFFPGFTLSTALCGMIPGLLEKIMERFRKIPLKLLNSLFIFLLSGAFLTVLIVSGTLHIFSGQIYYGQHALHWSIVALGGLIFIAYLLMPYLISRKFKNKYQMIDKVYFVVTITYLIVAVLLNTFFLSYYFGKGFLVFLPVRILSAYIMIPLNTVLIVLIFKTLKTNDGGKQRGLQE